MATLAGHYYLPVPLLLLVVCSLCLQPHLALTTEHSAWNYNSTYYVRPNTSTPCSSFSRCITLHDIAVNSSQYLKSQSMIVFMAGRHFMPSNTTILVEGIKQLQIVGTSASTRSLWPATESVIHCTENSAFLFINSIEISIVGLAFVSCGSEVSYQLHSTSHKFRAALVLVDVFNITILCTSVIEGSGYGLVGNNVLGNSIISHSSFVKNRGNVYLLYEDDSNGNCPDPVPEHQLTITNIMVLNGKPAESLSSNPTETNAAGCVIILNQMLFSLDVQVTNLTAVGNSGTTAANFYVSVDAGSHNRIVIDRCYSSLGRASDGGSGFYYYYTKPLWSPQLRCLNASYPSVLEIKHSQFEHNDGSRSVSCPSAHCSSAIHMSFNTRKDTRLQVVVIENTTITDSTGSAGAAINMFEFSHELHHRRVDVVIRDSTFTNTISTVYRKQFQGTVYFGNIRNATIRNCIFSNNSATAIIADDSRIYFNGNVTFYGNIGYNGGALALYANSIIYIAVDTHLQFISNEAENLGGAIYIASRAHTTTSRSLCFFQFESDLLWYAYYWRWSSVPIQIDFLENTAGFSGDDLYGGSLETCIVNVDDVLNVAGWWVIVTSSIFGPSLALLDIASTPSRACFCDDTFKPTCGVITTAVSVYPGALFSITAVAVGQWLTPVPASLNSILLDNSMGSYGAISAIQSVQDVQSECTQLSFDVSSPHAEEMIAVTIQKSSDREPIDSNVINTAIRWYEIGQPTDEFLHLPIYIVARLLPCPLGFELSKQNKCECTHQLKQHHVSCDIQDQTVHRIAPMWIGVMNTSSSKDVSYAVHKHCPFDYCKPDSIDMHMNSTDVQCNYNRSGMICGKCVDGLSEVFGSSKCKQCSNANLALLIAFAFSGALLLAFLVVTDLTVSAGTISGLVFYANIIGINRTALFPSGDFNILTIFIAWVNLDIGIETCFYDGMDAYAKSWLQFIFPAYIWIITGAVIFTSRHYTLVGRLCGRNIVHVLATLFLLSYSKLQRSIITALSFTVVEYDGKTESLWLYDGNVSYLQGKHIALLLFSIVALLCFFLPYTLVILLFQWLQPISNYRLLHWVQRLKPFFDANLGPYKDKHRYWPGLLLLARATLIIIYAGNILGDPNINLLATTIVADLILVALLVSGGVYKKWALNLLECFFLINLSILSTVVLFNGLTGGNTAAAVYFSTGLAFATFIGILAYHIWIKTKSCSSFSTLRKLITNLIYKLVQSKPEHDANPESIPNCVIQGPEVQASVLSFDEHGELVLAPATKLT